MNGTSSSVSGRAPLGRKKPTPLRNISLARFSSRFSRSNSRIRSRSVLVDRRVCLGQPLRVSPIYARFPRYSQSCRRWKLVQPIQSDSSPGAPAPAARLVPGLPGDNVCVLFITPSSQEMESPANPGGSMVVSCKSWQNGFNPASEIEAIQNNKNISGSGREGWKAFRELAKPKWTEAFLKVVKYATGEGRFTYVTAVTHLRGNNKDVWEKPCAFS